MQKSDAEEFYKSVGKVYCPYFQSNVIFSSEGFNHLQFSGGIKRKNEEQLLKFSLLKLAPYVIKNSGTIQEYRKTMYAVGKQKPIDGSIRMEVVEFWGLVAICGEKENQVRVKVILRRLAYGELAFWSVMPMQKFSKNSFPIFSSPVIAEE